MGYLYSLNKHGVRGKNMTTFDIAIWQADLYKLFGVTASDKEALILAIVYDTPYPKEVNALLGPLLIKHGVEEALSLVKQYDGVLYTIHNNEVHTIYELPKGLRSQRKLFHFVPPSIEVLPIVSNNKGLLLNAHHNEYQNYDFINKIQKIQWKLDPVVIIEEKRTLGGSDSRYLRVMRTYLGEHFYFNWQFDSRGRSYTRGYDINLQSDEYHKAMLSMQEELITNEDTLKIAIANHAGHDKWSWEERINWFDTQTEFDTDSFVEPILGRKALRAYQDYLDGYPSGYWMALDATASGLQIMALLSDCMKTARATNLIDRVRHDVYTEIALAMNALLPVNEHVNRKQVKKPVMTHYYNSLSIPKAAFSETQLEAFYTVLQSLFPGAEAVMSILNTCWDNTATYHQWVLPDGHVAKVAVTETATWEIQDEYLGDITFSMKIEKASDNGRSLCPNIIHSIDAYITREMVRRADFDLAHIHDAFVFHPNNMLTVMQLYREVLSDINKMDLLSDIVRQLKGIHINAKPTHNLSTHILNSSYALS